VLKIGVPHRELTSEIAALRFCNGQGVVRLIEADESRGMFLLERLRPGLMLSILENDEQATHIAADVMLKLWRPVNLESDGLPSEIQKHTPSGYLASGLHKLIKLSDWFDGFKRLRARYDGGTGPLDEKLVEKAEGIAKDFFAEHYTPTLIHGDFHHFNILSSERGCAAGIMPATLRSSGTMPPSWLAIDPKGVIGPAAYEVGPLLLNPMPDFLNGTNPKVQTEKRIDILSERLGFERERIRNWGFAHAVLSAWWSMEDNGDRSYAMRCAELFMGRG
jgi:streptomycin 6-kinase